MLIFATIWPWISLGAAGMLLILLFAGDGLAADRSAPRWRDMAWLTWLGVAACLLQQFEGSGIDLYGRSYALMGALCTGLGFRDAVACPVPLSFITAFNVGTVWMAGLIAGLAASRRPLLGLGFFAIPLANLVLHTWAAIVFQRYNPGLLVSAVVFLPLSVYAMTVAVRRYGAGARDVGAVLLAGGFICAVLIAGLAAYLGQIIGEIVLMGALLVAALAPSGFVLLATRETAIPARIRTPRPRRTPQEPRSPRRRKAVEGELS